MGEEVAKMSSSVRQTKSFTLATQVAGLAFAVVCFVSLCDCMSATERNGCLLLSVYESLRCLCWLINWFMDQSAPVEATDSALRYRSRPLSIGYTAALQHSVVLL